MCKLYADTLNSILSGEGCQQANEVDTYSTARIVFSVLFVAELGDYKGQNWPKYPI